MRDMILEALAHIPASKLDYQDWLSIGMALKSEGYDVTVFDDWSRSDTERYAEGKCQEKWKTFNDGGVTGATIMYWAKHYGYVPHSYEVQLLRNRKKLGLQRNKCRNSDTPYQ